MTPAGVSAPEIPSERTSRTYAGVMPWMASSTTCCALSVPSRDASSRTFAEDARERARTMSSRSPMRPVPRTPRALRVPGKARLGRKRKNPVPRPSRKTPSISKVPASRSSRKVTGAGAGELIWASGSPRSSARSTEFPQLEVPHCTFR
jgi:hypothetical protein